MIAESLRRYWKDVQIALPFAFALFGFAGLLVAASAFTWGTGASLSGNLWLNLVAEIAGIAVAIIVAVPVASRFARSRLAKIAPEYAALIAQLRVDGTITCEAARKSIICTVALIADDQLEVTDLLQDAATAPQQCDVCALDFLTKEEHCFHCGLHRKAWNIPGLMAGRKSAQT